MIELNGRKVADNMKENLKNYFSDSKFEGKYIAIFLLSDDKASETYVNFKKQFGEDIGLKVAVFGNKKFDEEFQGDLDYLNYSRKDYDSLDEIYSSISFLNDDENCIGIMFQLPFPEKISNYEAEILSSIKTEKDIDGLGGNSLGLSCIGYFDLSPATAAAVFNIFDYYGLDSFQGKKVSVIGQSNIVGKPIAIDLINKGAEVFSFNYMVSEIDLIDICKKSDIIISATGKPHLIDSNFLSDNGNQILIDVGFTKKDEKIYGDINYEDVKNKVYAITPVPGGVGPVTVASLFDNIRKLN